jgi:sphingosine kinase
MGDTRTVVGLLQEIFTNKAYQIEASVLIAESDKENIKASCRANLKASVWKSCSGEGKIQDTIPPLSEPVPDHWTTINDHISFFLTSKVPLLNRGMLSHPCASPNDGLIDLLMVRSGKSIAKQLGVFTSIENGKHIDMDIVSIDGCGFV